MIKKKITISLLLISFALVSFGQKSLSAEENSGLDKLIKENVFTESERITSKAVSKVLIGNFFDVKVYSLLGRSTSYQEYKLMEIEDRILNLNDIKKLLSVIKKEFKIDSEKNALKFEKMLNILFPSMYISSVKHYKKGNLWIFVRKEFFGEIEAYEVKINEIGKVISIEDKENIQE